MNRARERRSMTAVPAAARLGPGGALRPAWVVTAALMLTGLLLGGCLGAPRLEDRWTRVDIVSSNTVPYQTIPTGSDSFAVHARITYRTILTGFAVVELRGSTTMTPTSVEIAPLAPRLAMAKQIDTVLAHSVTLGRVTRAITGWDHLIQDFDLGFNGTVPATLTDSSSTGPPAGLFLLCYLGSGQKIERVNQPDTLIVTPFGSSQYQLLPVGMSLTP
jgi:hypothetical protein